MFSLKNSITIKHGEFSQTSSNNVLNIMDALRAGAAYGNFMILRTQNNQSFRESSYLESINNNVLNGALIAHYSATFSDEALNGETFNQAGLSHNGTTFFNVATFTPFVKQEGIDIHVTVTVVVNLTGNTNMVSGGDNRFMRVVLGAEPYENSWRAISDICNHLDFPHERNIAETPTMGHGTNGTFTGNSLTVLGRADVNSSETVFLYQNIPAFRVFLPNQISIQTTSGVVQNDRTVAVNFDDIETLTGATMTGGSLAGMPQLVHSTNRLFRIGSQINFSVGRGARLVGSPFAQSVVLATTHELILIRPNSTNGELEVVQRYPNPVFQNGQPDNVNGFSVTGFATVAVFSNDITVYFPSGDVTRIPLARGEQNVFIDEGISFHYARISNGRLERFRITPAGAITQIEDSTVPSDTRIFRSNNSIMVLSRDGASRYLNSLAADTNLGIRLSVIMNTSNIPMQFTASDSIVFGRVYAANMFFPIFGASQIVQTHFAGFETVQLAHDFVFRSGASVLNMFNRVTRTMVTVPISGQVAPFTSLADVGNYILAINENGEVATYFKNRFRGYIFHQGFNIGANVTVHTRTRRVNFANHAQAVLTIDFT
ncbi:MAG: hypothetical protein FWC11_01060 [Firmicutes bacterium]|nr:hypothetical protein [Bacillota bacterium]